MSRFSSRWRTLACAAFLCLLPFTLLLPVTVGGRTLIPADNLFQYEPWRSESATGDLRGPSGALRLQNELASDLVLQNYAWKSFLSESIRAGELPLWNPYLFAGVPFLAAGQHSALYPFTALFLLMPIAAAFGWFMASQLALAGLSMFALIRTYGLRRSSAVFAAVGFQLCGLLVIGVVHPMIVASAAWLPLILALIDKVIHAAPGLGGRPASLPWAVLGALAVGCHLLAGHVEISVYTALVAAAYALHRVLTSGRLRDHRFVAARIAWLVVLGGGGALLAAIQLAPLFELVTQNFRGAGRSSFEQVLSYAFPLRYVLLWLTPNLFGSWGHHAYFDWFTLRMEPITALQGTWWGYAAKEQVESSVYAGLATLLLAVVGAVVGVRNVRNTPGSSGAPAMFFLGLAVLSALFIFGTRAYAVLYYGLPGIDQLHSPFRWKYPLTAALCVLAALGFERWTSADGDVRLRRWLAGSIAGLGVAVLLGTLASRLAWSSVRDAVAAMYADSTLAAQRFASPEAFFSYLAGNFAIFGAILVAVGAAAAWKPGRRQAAALILVLAVDLNIAWVGFIPSVDPALLDVQPAALRPLREDAEAVGALKLWRVTSYEPSGAVHDKPANANSLWTLGLQDVRGYDSIIPKRYVEYMKAIEPQGDLLYNRISPLRERASLESPLLDLLGVKYVLTENTIDVPGYEELPGIGNLRIYRNTRAMPRAYLMPAAATVAPDAPVADGSWFAAAIRRFDPRRFVIVNDPVVCRPSCPAPQPAQFSPATITAYANSEMWVDAQRGPGREWLIVNDSWFPGWRAFIRPLGAPDDAEIEVPVTLVNGNFRGVRLDQAALPAETSVVTVRLKYSPDSVRFGAFASVLTAVALAFAAGVYAWRSLAVGADSLSGAGRVARNSFVLSGMNIVARLISFVFAIVVARLLGPDGVGAYYFAVVIIGWFDILLNYGLNTYLTREVARDRQHAGAYFRHTTILRLLLALAAAPLLALVLGGGFAVGYFSREVAVTIAILGASQVVSSLNTGLSALFFAFEHGEVPASLSVLSSLATAAVGAVLLSLGWGVPALAITSVIVNVGTFLFLAALARRRLGLRLSRGTDGFAVRTSRAQILRESTPLMLNHLLASIEFKIDVPLLKAATPSMTTFGARQVTSEEVVGWYSTGYRFVDAFNIIPSFFTQSLFPALSRMAERGSDAFMRAFSLAVKLLVIVSLPLAVGTTFLSNTLAGFFGAEFLPHSAVAISIMAWSMIAGWINSVTNYALIAVNQQRTITRAFAATLIFNLGANLLFVPLFSYQAAAVVTIGSEIVKGAIFYFYVRRHIGPLHWRAILAKPALAAGMMAAAAGVGAWFGFLLPGLALGAALYVAALALLRALDEQESAVLAPLLRRRN